MRVQNINQNIYKYKSSNNNKTPGFKANVISVVKGSCHEGEWCPQALNKLKDIFETAAFESGNIKQENATAGTLMMGADSLKLILVDETTALGKKIMELPSFGEVIEALVQTIKKPDAETVEVPLVVKEADICPLYEGLSGGPRVLN